MVNSGCLMGRGENSKKGTRCEPWGISEQKVVGHLIMFCPLEGHPRAVD